MSIQASPVADPDVVLRSRERVRETARISQDVPRGVASVHTGVGVGWYEIAPIGMKAMTLLGPEKLRVADFREHPHMRELTIRIEWREALHRYFSRRFVFPSLRCKRVSG